MVGNHLQFAVVREDPAIECAVVRKVGKSCKMLLMGSGGCTALTLRNEFPDAAVTVLDPNPSQIDLIRKKMHALKDPDLEALKKNFGIDRCDDPTSLTGSGNFESLFRGFRNFIYEFACGRDEWLSFFNDRSDSLEKVFHSKYWPAAFELYFSDPMLLAMFGRNAIQYAPKGSYPAYFQQVMESGLLAPDAKTNYFLHHIFLGHYLDDPRCLPLYLKAPWHEYEGFQFVEADAQHGPDFCQFDVISFSNIFDWMDQPDIVLLAKRLVNEMQPGASLIWRQLNNQSNLRSLFEPSLSFDQDLATELHASDQSHFYSSVHIGLKNGAKLMKDGPV